ncbi:MAG: hypothetical protein GX492_00265 [Firmicutes bacterium]|nr:hypothetical protein [Bacillota bacterium]
MEGLAVSLVPSHLAAHGSSRRTRASSGSRRSPAFPRQGAGIGCRPCFTHIHLDPFYRAEFGFKEGDFSAAELAGRTSIAIPSHPIPSRNHLTADGIDYVADVLERALGEVR